MFSIKSGIRSILDPIAAKFGYSRNSAVHSFWDAKNDLLINFYENLLKMEFKPQHVVDIGANHGTWTREALKYFPEAYYSLVEPQYWLEESIQDLLQSNEKVKFYGCGAGAESGSFLFSIANRDDSCSFLYSKEEAENLGFKQIELPVRTLNDILKDSQLPTPDIIKVDAEGLDLAVLEGASDYFGLTEVFMVEASVVNNIYTDNDVISMINYMERKGYTLFEITDLNRPFTPRVLWLVELVFVKKQGILNSFTFDN